jgi:hypothetical protein
VTTATVVTRESNQTRRRALQTLGGAVVVGLAGCSSSAPGDASEQSTTAPTSTSTPTETATESPTPEETTHTDHEHTHTESMPPESVDFVENPEAIHPTLADATSIPDGEVLLGFRLEDSSLPFTTEVYHAPEDATVQATETYDSQNLADVDLVPSSPTALETVDTDHEDIHYATTPVGEPLTVTLVAQHDGEAFEWSAWERTGYPYDGHNDENLGLQVACYCGGMTYTAPSGGTWARVIQVTPTEVVDPGTAVAVNWTSSRTPESP